MEYIAQIPCTGGGLFNFRDMDNQDVKEIIALFSDLQELEKNSLIQELIGMTIEQRKERMCGAKEEVEIIDKQLSELNEIISRFNL